ncbi:GRIN [Lepeophtheirus salmonis]|uniref:GRIN n=1 Tax=Lepeophtheirus salmonis TaxID=72036 RepID=A0A7R8CM45_LEPSM|nr:GRIN [Lepeophtheirus salmonis]CAF2818227.1 GRIN [Lepeophtheirus salmonis]
MKILKTIILLYSNGAVENHPKKNIEPIIMFNFGGENIVVCELLDNGIVSLFGPTDLLLGSHIQNLCDALDIPHLEARMDIEDSFKEFSINLHPSQDVMNKAYKDLMVFLNWTNAAILYEDDFGLVRLQDLYHYTFTSFDVETFDLEDFKYNHVNLTSFRLVDPESIRAKKVFDEMVALSPIRRSILNSTNIILTEPALIYDSVMAFAKGLENVSALGSLISMPKISCNDELPWEGGSILFNYISSVKFYGLTGPIRFLEAKRSGLKMDLLKLKAGKMTKVGEWKQEIGLNITDIIERPFVMFKKTKEGWNNKWQGNDRFEGFCVDLLQQISEQVGFNYVIELVDDNNYGALNLSTGIWNGFSERTYAFTKFSDAGVVRHQQLLSYISEYTTDIQHISGKDNTVGDTGGFSVFETIKLIEGNADMAMGAMTINFARETVIDFTKPFMNLGISILFKIPSGKPTRLFSFMNPLALEIWLYVLAAYILVSLTLFVMARFSPYEWNNPHPCETENDIMENQFSISNSFWFITGTFLRQGSGLNPKAASTRIVGGIWWFFTLIIISSYTANLAAFLTVERMITPIENAEDLARQKIEYGTLSGGSTMTFFRDSKIEVYREMWKFMESRNPSVFVDNYDTGINSVKNGGYAFLMESTMLDYVVQVIFFFIDILA